MQELIPALTEVAAIAGTLEYAMLIRRRQRARADAREREEAGETGLQGLVRVLLTDKGVTVGTYLPE